MKVSLVAGFGPIVRNVDSSRGFWGSGLGIELEEAEQAAKSCFGSDAWPEEIPAPQAWIELDVESPEAVTRAIAELEGAGHRVLRGVGEEPWGQTTSRVLSPEGLLIGVTYTPWMHPKDGNGATAG